MPDHHAPDANPSDVGAPRRSTLPVEVRYAETDQMGVVHHSVYLVWFELARTHLCRESGTSYAEVEDLGYFLMVTRTGARYVQPAHYGDTVEVTCWIDRLASRGLRFGYEVRRDRTLLATGATEHVWVERASGRPCRIPQILDAPFRRLAGQAVTPRGL